MAQADWTVLTNSLSGSSVAKGVTAGETPPAGGESFVYGMASKTITPGAVGLYCNLSNFSPMSKGGAISGALKKAGGGGDDSHAAFLFIGLQGTAVESEGY